MNSPYEKLNLSLDTQIKKNISNYFVLTILSVIFGIIILIIIATLNLDKFNANYYVIPILLPFLIGIFSFYKFIVLYRFRNEINHKNILITMFVFMIISTIIGLSFLFFALMFPVYALALRNEKDATKINNLKEKIIVIKYLIIVFVNCFIIFNIVNVSLSLYLAKTTKNLKR
ncbi:hypothetical protein [Metamycoplasma buccale]|uniref:hypothetical protein n=1 Tax=Metamycoplasma buccale TaxID=55602 RepID=UPI00398EBAB4